MFQQLDLLNLAVRAAGFLVAISIHEFSHAFAAWRLGDSTARLAGRLTLNPLRHLDPFGTILLLLAGFGWGKPVPVDPRQLRFGRRGMAIVSAAGPLSNLLMAAVIALFLRGSTAAGVDLTETGYRFLILLTVLNVGLCVFNLLPIPPLDGFGVAVGVLPWPLARLMAGLARYGAGILLILFVAPTFLHVDLLSLILDGPRTALLRPILQLAGIRL